MQTSIVNVKSRAQSAVGRIARHEGLLHALYALMATVPAWIVRHPPLQDLPFHLATINVLAHYGDPAWGYAQTYELTLGRTQYLVYYGLAVVLSKLVGVFSANLMLMCVYLAGTPLTVMYVLRGLKVDARAAWFTIPLLYNVMWQFGLLPFVFGIPIGIFAVGLALRDISEPSPKRALALAAAAFVLFFVHIFPFVLFGLSYIALFPWSRPRVWLRALMPMLPAAGVMASWSLFTLAGRTAVGLDAQNTQDPVLPWREAYAQIFQWLGDIFRDDSDLLVWKLVVGLAVLSTIVALATDSSARRGYRLVLLSLVCAVLYFVTPQSRGPIYWLYSQRFPVLLVMCASLLVRLPRGAFGHVAALCGWAVSCFAVVNTAQHYVAFETDELGDIDGAIDSIPPGHKVAALVYDKWSTIMHWAPYLHMGSYYQAQKPGLVQFAYTGYDHWPFTYRVGHEPPPGTRAPLRWEWMPEAVSVQRELVPFYDDVLTRGPGFAPPPGTYVKTGTFDRWTVWHRASQ